VDEGCLLRVRAGAEDGKDLKVWKRGYHAKMIQQPSVFGHEGGGEMRRWEERVVTSRGVGRSHAGDCAEFSAGFAVLLLSLQAPERGNLILRDLLFNRRGLTRSTGGFLGGLLGKRCWKWPPGLWTTSQCAARVEP